MIKEFKQFISRGNVVDLAVGVIIGAAFSKIVTSLVNDLIMPFIGIILGGIDFSMLTLKINNATINYGMFLQNILDFFIVSVCVFLIVKIMNKLANKKKEEEIPKLTKDQELLQKILEELQNN